MLAGRGVLSSDNALEGVKIGIPVEYLSLSGWGDGFETMQELLGDLLSPGSLDAVASLRRSRNEVGEG